MAHHQTTPRRPAGDGSPTGRTRTTGLGVVLVLLVAGCAIGGAEGTRSGPGTVAPSSPMPSADSPSGAPHKSDRAAPEPPTTVPGESVAQPPQAVLGGLSAPPDPGAPGALGSWTWGTAGDDAPWLVPSAGGGARAGVELAVTFDPDVAAGTWTARWARILDGSAGEPVETATGSGPVVLATPGSGTWSLQVDARFGRGQQAAWYWRLEVVP